MSPTAMWVIQGRPAKAVGATPRVGIMQDVVVHQHAALRLEFASGLNASGRHGVRLEATIPPPDAEREIEEKCPSNRHFLHESNYTASICYSPGEYLILRS
jgi:hypothetical protein